MLKKNKKTKKEKSYQHHHHHHHHVQCLILDITMNHNPIYNYLNQSCADGAGKETVKKLCQPHPKVPGTSKSPKNYILSYIRAAKHKHDLKGQYDTRNDKYNHCVISVS